MKTVNKQKGFLVTPAVLGRVKQPTNNSVVVVEVMVTVGIVAYFIGCLISVLSGS